MTSNLLATPPDLKSSKLPLAPETFARRWTASLKLANLQKAG
jgi:hypothetical protein